MRIHALSTGTVRVKESFLLARTGVRRQVALLLPSPWSSPLPIHVWVVEHAGRTILVDTGETRGVRDIPFARFDVTASHELPAVLAAAGLSLEAVDTTVLTHLHADHMDGARFIDGPVLVHDAELAFSATLRSRVAQRVFHQPLPAAADLRPMALDNGTFGGFAASKALTDDGRVVAVSTPGHTPGHISVVCIDDDGRHVFLAGDTTDTLEQLHARRSDAVSPDPAVTVATIDAILAHGQEHPTVYLPSHDVESAARLRDGIVL